MAEGKLINIQAYSCASGRIASKLHPLRFRFFMSNVTPCNLRDNEENVWYFWNICFYFFILLIFYSRYWQDGLVNCLKFCL